MSNGTPDIKLEVKKVKEIDVNFIPKLCIKPEPIEFFKFNGVIPKITVYGEIEGVHEVLSKLDYELYRHEMYSEDKAVFWCKPEIYETVFNSLKTYDVIIHVQEKEYRWDPNKTEYILKYVPDLQKSENWWRLFLQPLYEGYDATKINVTVNLVQDDLIAPSRKLNLGDLDLNADALSDFPEWTKVNAPYRFNAPYKFKLPSLQSENVKYTYESPLVVDMYFDYQLTFPNSIAKFSMLYYGGDFRRQIRNYTQSLYR